MSCRLLADTMVEYISHTSKPLRLISYWRLFTNLFHRTIAICILLHCSVQRVILLIR